MFDFNINGLRAGSEIRVGGEAIYSIVKIWTPEGSIEVRDCLNSAAWVRAENLVTYEVFSQPIQWFNAVIKENDATITRCAVEETGVVEDA